MKGKELLIGAHKSIAGGVYKALKQGEESGCKTIQVFTKNASQWRAKPLPEEDVVKFKEEVKRTGITPVVAHDSYLINLASPNDELLEKSINAYVDELERCELLEIPYLVMHPGSHMKCGDEAGLDKVAKSLNTIHKMAKGFNVKTLLETTAGQGTNLGYKFEHLRTIYDKVKESDRLGYCYDTCHTFVAGYDIRTVETYEKTMSDFDNILGITNLKCFHINDAKKDFLSRVDRHEQIGMGTIGDMAFALIMQDKRFENIPKILETPKEKGIDSDIINLDRLKKLYKKRISR
ncbi:deoxyribonuclease IV [Thermodesulfobacteriota bacterium]